MTAPKNDTTAWHWSQLEERGVLFGLRFMLAAYRLLGRKGFLLFLYPVTAYFFLSNTVARRASQQFLNRVYADKRGKVWFQKPPDHWATFQHIFAFGEATMDKLAAWVGDINESNVRVENIDVFESLIEDGRGGLIIVSHMGNSEVSRALGTRRLRGKINALVHTKHSGNFNRLLRQMNPDSAVDLIQVTDVNPSVAMMLSEKIARGEFVVIAGDRTPAVQESSESTSRYSWIPFLGYPAPFPQGPFILANLLKCPVLTMFCTKQSGKYTIAFEKFAEKVLLPRNARGDAMDHYIAQYVRHLENHCCATPYQWFNFFDFWNQAGKVPMTNSPGKYRTK